MLGCIEGKKQPTQIPYVALSTTVLCGLGLKGGGKDAACLSRSMDGPSKDPRKVRGAQEIPKGRNIRATFLLVTFLWSNKEKSHAAIRQN
jgi:hypothetical protein